ncbi:thioredoxin family protein [Chryseobacterium arthrosphaerae]|uniref:Thioredoxin family protein n=1 Tax=Chryseobacterium arthrosphaerae TaxID=651561 RepID=A0A3S0QG12_9FLAO|nr:thioredoxin family protein [Chryseobacterium arthrosphaerae]
MYEKPIFYHAGCPVCISAEHDIISLIGAENVEIVHLGMTEIKFRKQNRRSKIRTGFDYANGNVLHINFGASMEDVKK